MKSVSLRNASHRIRSMRRERYLTAMVLRVRPNEMEFSGERSESAGAPGMGAEEEVRDLPGP